MFVTHLEISRILKKIYGEIRKQQEMIPQKRKRNFSLAVNKNWKYCYSLLLDLNSVVCQKTVALVYNIYKWYNIPYNLFGWSKEVFKNTSIHDMMLKNRNRCSERCGFPFKLLLCDQQPSFSIQVLLDGIRTIVFLLLDFITLFLYLFGFPSSKAFSSQR